MAYSTQHQFRFRPEQLELLAAIQEEFPVSRSMILRIGVFSFWAQFMYGEATKLFEAGKLTEAREKKALADRIGAEAHRVLTKAEDGKKIDQRWEVRRVPA